MKLEIIQSPLSFSIGESAIIELTAEPIEVVKHWKWRYDLDIGEDYLDKVMSISKIQINGGSGLDGIEELMEHVGKFADSHNFVIAGVVKAKLPWQMVSFYTRHGFGRTIEANDGSYLVMRY